MAVNSSSVDSSTIQAISAAVAGALSPILQPRQQLNTINVVGQSTESSSSRNGTSNRSASTESRDTESGMPDGFLPFQPQLFICIL